METLCVTVGGGCGLGVIVLSQTDSKPQIRPLFELELSWALIGFVLRSFGVTYCTLWRLTLPKLLADVGPTQFRRDKKNYSRVKCRR